MNDQKRVLIVDSCLPGRETMRTILEKSGALVMAHDHMFNHPMGLCPAAPKTMRSSWSDEPRAIWSQRSDDAIAKRNRREARNRLNEAAQGRTP